MSLENKLVAIISPHLPSDRGWCSACKTIVMNKSQHIAEKLIEAGVELNVSWFKQQPNPLNFICPTCGAVEGEACRDSGVSLLLNTYHVTRGGA